MLNDTPTSAESYPQLMLEHQLCFPLYAASKEVVRSYRPFLDDVGLTYTQYLVLLALWEYAPLTMVQLGKHIFLDSGTLTPVINKLVQAGYIAKTAKNGRTVELAITPAGWELRERLAQVPFELARCFSAPQPEHTDEHALSKEQLIELLERTLQALKA